MTDDKHAYWLDYLRSLADQIGLKDWDIILGRDEPNGDDVLADVTCTTGQKSAFVRLSKNIQNETPEKQREVLLHELLHCHFDDIDTAVYHAVEVIGGSAIELCRKIVKDRIEFATDAVAIVVAPFYPLPPEWMRG